MLEVGIAKVAAVYSRDGSNIDDEMCDRDGSAREEAAMEAVFLALGRKMRDVFG